MSGASSSTASTSCDAGDNQDNIMFVCIQNSTGRTEAMKSAAGGGNKEVIFSHIKEGKGPIRTDLTPPLPSSSVSPLVGQTPVMTDNSTGRRVASASAQAVASSSSTAAASSDTLGSGSRVGRSAPRRQTDGNRDTEIIDLVTPEIGSSSPFSSSERPRNN
ncbi:hypothetical protein CBOM_05689 [Ceraceosorus bombacis]|uniref:Uncharacterized protein n=1 Tax=Ceraceosorus bombacis TaxID=401625 RepID=A0A0P1BRS9_9BASI|nr:hypothetical protein CBOM_05689 [Ceraceosorus bombacis]